jgi:hypothetical protein
MTWKQYGSVARNSSVLSPLMDWRAGRCVVFGCAIFARVRSAIFPDPKVLRMRKVLSELKERVAAMNELNRRLKMEASP